MDGRREGMEGWPEAAKPGAGGTAVALGSDPFAEPPGPDPFVEGMRALGVAEPAIAGESQLAEPAEPTPAPAPLHGPGWTRTPELDEIELPEATDWLDHLIPAEERQRLACLSHLVQGEESYDRFGFSPEVLRRSFPVFHALYRLYFRVQSHGHEHIPASGPAILAGNHAGMLPFDAAMLVVDGLLHSNPPRLVRAVVDRWAGSLPWVNIFYSRVGQIIGTRENFSDLLDDGQLLLVFPEGMAGARKTISQRYRVQPFRVGFIEQALTRRAPVVPVAVVGSDDQTPILFDVKPLARALGLPVAPITPTFPWLGPLGLLPYPVRYRIVYGEPLCFHERFGPEDAEDPRLVQHLSGQVRAAVQQLLDRNR